MTGRHLLIAAAIVCAFGAASGNAQAAHNERLKQQLAREVDDVGAEIGSLAAEIWSFAELGLRETRSAALLADRLQKEGFSVQRGVADMPTAFIATYGSGGPVIGILAEYDALPAIGNAIDPDRRPREDNVTSGHGCGHNLFGAASIGAAVALKRLMVERRLAGTLKVFGTPAEEDDIGKLYMAKAGVFDKLDVALEWHPSVRTATTNERGLALNNFQVEFFGRAAHASAEPENGRSALDALEMTTFGINLLREHVRSTVRMHYYIADGGAAPNIVPDYARLVVNVRDVDRAGVVDAYERVTRIADAAAIAMGVERKITLFSALHAVLLNRPLQEAMEANLQRLGPVAFDEQDQAFARGLQKSLGATGLQFNGAVAPLEDVPSYTGGSTDVAEVSWIAPTVGFTAATAPEGVPWHSWATTASHGTDTANKGAVHAAKLLGLMGVDLLTDPALLGRARAQFLRATGGKPYVAGIPTDQRPPLERAATK